MACHSKAESGKHFDAKDRKMLMSADNVGNAQHMSDGKQCFPHISESKLFRRHRFMHTIIPLKAGTVHSLTNFEMFSQCVITT